jgi:hypothetical protein
VEASEVILCRGCRQEPVGAKGAKCRACRRRQRYATDPVYADARRREAREYDARKSAERPTHFTPPE